MPRRPRIEVDGGVYHVYNRVASGERVFEDPDVAIEFAERIRSVKERDGWVVFAWCVMENHYHLAIRRSTVDLAASLHSLQGKFSRAFNRRWGRSGGLWHSRYQAKLINEQRYLSQVVLYIHLNPVQAKAVTDPLAHKFSGHREVVRGLRRGLVDADDTLLCFGETRRAARRTYLAAMRAGVEDALHPSEGLPDGGGARRWWDVIPWKESSDDELESGRPRAARHGAECHENPPPAFELVGAACEVLSVSQIDLNGKGRTRELATQRRLVAAVLRERWGVHRRDLAEVLDRNPEVLSHWVAEARARQKGEPEFGERVDALDAALQERFVSARGP